jgi:hypothetical protein
MPRKNKKSKKEYQKEYHKRRYSSDPEYVRCKKENAKKHRTLQLERNREWIRQYKASRYCVKCSEYHTEYVESNSVCLCFHHLDSKEKDGCVSVMVLKRYSIKCIEKEISKCILVCLNCHARIHAEQGYM